jgi:hypothetical protein
VLVLGAASSARTLVPEGETVSSSVSPAPGTRAPFAGIACVPPE